MSNQEITIGEREGWGATRRFGISEKDQRQHVYVVGKTGSGKTTLLRNILIQHILAGHGVGLIDPHGDLAIELLNHIPPSRTHDLCYFNPGDLDYPIGLNPLSGFHTSPDLVASGIVSAFKGIWRDSWGPRMEYILFSAVMTLLECPNMTLLGLNQLLSNDAYRAWALRQIGDLVSPCISGPVNMPDMSRGSAAKPSLRFRTRSASSFKARSCETSWARSGIEWISHS